MGAALAGPRLAPRPVGERGARDRRLVPGHEAWRSPARLRAPARTTGAGVTIGADAATAVGAGAGMGRVPASAASSRSIRASSAGVDGSTSGAAALIRTSSSWIRGWAPLAVASSAAETRSSRRTTEVPPIAPACASRRASRSGVTRSSSGTSRSTWTASSSRPWTSRSRRICPGSRPDEVSLAALRRPPAGSPAITASSASNSCSASATPSTASTSAATIGSSPV